jgi:hypothetical protein
MSAKELTQMQQENAVLGNSGWVTFIPLLLLAFSTGISTGLEQEPLASALVFALLTCVL